PTARRDASRWPWPEHDPTGAGTTQPEAGNWRGISLLRFYRKRLGREFLSGVGPLRKLLCANGFEDARPVASLASGVGLLVESVSGDERQGDGGLAVDHLLVCRVHLAPGACFLQR